MSKKFQWLIVIIAFLIHLFFYISAFKTHALDKFFPLVTQGQDFFQIPNAARSFLKGGSLTGHNHLYTDCCGVNDNVYHPFFTLLVGILLQFFKPWTAYNLWLLIHWLSDIFILFFLIKKFKNHKYLIPTIVFFLVNSLIYNEILNNQYHFLLSLFIFLFLYEISVNKDSAMAGFFYLFSLIVKPIGLLWIIPLLFQKKFKTFFTGLGLFLICSVPFFLNSMGNYYFNNLFGKLTNNYPDWNIFFLLTYKGGVINSLQIITLLVALCLIVFSFVKRKNFFEVVFLWIAYSLLFYPLTFPYHYSVLPYLISLGILLNRIKFALGEKITFILISLPSPIFFLRLLVKNNLVSYNSSLEKFTFISWSMLGVSLLSILIIYNLLLNVNEKE